VLSDGISNSLLSLKIPLKNLIIKLMLVMKFGGSTIPDASGIKCIARIIERYKGNNPVVVVSAVEGVTDKLIELGRLALSGHFEGKFDRLAGLHQKIIDELGLDSQIIKSCLYELRALLKGIKLLKELTPRTLDYIMSFGERLSVRINAGYLQKIGIDAEPIDAFDIGMLTNNEFGKASPLPETYYLLKQHLANIQKIPVITGFIGKTKDGEITTLGRNGSDFTASIIGNAIDAKEIQIWRDVDGVMTADPETVRSARPVKTISFEEASELVYYGTRLLHPAMLIPAIEKNIPIRILNIFKPDDSGTTILSKSDKRFSGIKSITCKKNQTVLTITTPKMLFQHGYMAKIFDILRRHKVVVDMISTSEVSVSLTINPLQDIKQVINELKEFSEIEVERGMSIICVVGDDIKYTPGISGLVFKTMGQEDINVVMISQGASKSNLAFVIKDEDAGRAVNALHRSFFED
jgi:aspartate kinase